MHLEGPWLSTTATKKRATTLNKRQQEEMERGWKERNVFLRSINLPKETFEQYLDWIYGRGKKDKTKAKYDTKYSPTVTKVSASQTRFIDSGKSNGQIPNDETKREEEVRVVSETPRSLSSWITGPVASKPSPTYTGTKILGIGTMHKSNAVPIFSDEEAKEVSSMRR